jgi:hypothetical protein
MGLGVGVSRVVAFLRAGYPRPAPALGYVPLLALLPRRVTDDEVRAIARKFLMPKRIRVDNDVDNADVGVEIINTTDAMPSADDIGRVQRRLMAMKSGAGQQD